MNFKHLTAAACAALLLHAQTKDRYAGWSDYGGSSDSMQYSALKRIDKSNVGRLKLAWFHAGPGPGGRFSFNPLVVDGVMYVVGRDNAIVALDAATGQQIWTHPNDGQPTNRGFNYWESKDRADRRLIFAVNSYLQEVNARTGVTINTFGNDGRVNLREGLGRDPKNVGDVQSGTPGRVFENLVILGRRRAKGTSRRPGICAHMTFERANSHGSSTPSRIPASSVTIPGRQTPGSTSAGPTRGARSRSTKSGASRTFRWAPRRTIYTAPTVTGANLFGNTCSRWTRGPASGSGISKWSITTCGTTTWSPRPSF